jgi:acyl-CoA synthetase (AMP-forming)/AMP-acid ligase II
MQGLTQNIPLLLSSVLEHAGQNFGDVAIVSCSQQERVRYDYRRAAARTRRLASTLSARGFGSDSFVGSLAWNTHRHLELFYGVSGIGAVLHTANPRLAPEQIAYTINFSRYDTLFIDADTVLLAEALAPRLESVTRFVIMCARADMPATSLASVECYEDLIEAGAGNFRWPVFDERTACTLCFTSGTTGVPKGALYSHRGTVLSTMSTGGGNGWAVSADDAIIAIPGFFHCNGWAIPFFGPMFGARLVLPGRHADTEFLHDLIIDEGVTIAPGVPTIWISMLEYCQRTGKNFGRVKRLFTGGTAPPAVMIDAYLRDYGVRTSHAWGMTETTHGATVSFVPQNLPREAAIAAMRTQGQPAYGIEIRIVDDNGKPLPRDGQAKGHLQCRGHWIASSYFRRPDIEVETADGWMQTGDVAVIDPDNTMHIVDRAKDVIKSGGEWISSQALEEAAMRHTSVQEAAVVAIAHPRWQERPFMIVVRQPGHDVSTDILRAHLELLVPKWWLPDAFAFVDALPHGPTGKVQKETLRHWLREGKVSP